MFDVVLNLGQGQDVDIPALKMNVPDIASNVTDEKSYESALAELRKKSLLTLHAAAPVPAAPAATPPAQSQPKLAEPPKEPPKDDENHDDSKKKRGGRFKRLTGAKK
jgi:ribosomal protein L12E/L44/L45/RPP1/RPP2